MPNKWVEHVKKFAKDNNLTYGCALSDPNLRKGYVPTGKKAQAKRADEEREKRQDDEEARVKKEKEREKFLSLVKADSGTQPPTKITAKQMRHRAFLEKYKDNSELLRKDLTEALNKNTETEKLIGQLHDEYLRLWKMKSTKQVRNAIQEVEDMANELIRPILKKQLAQGFFPTEKDKKYGEMKFKVVSFAERGFVRVKEKKIFEFFLDGKKLDEEDDIGIIRKTSEHYDPNKALYEALRGYYRYRFFGNVAGMRNFEEFMKFAPKLI